jgi:hypothetical protein
MQHFYHDEFTNVIVRPRKPAFLFWPSPETFQWHLIYVSYFPGGIVYLISWRQVISLSRSTSAEGVFSHRCKPASSMYWWPVRVNTWWK